MKLRDWLTREKVTVVTLANYLGVSRCYTHVAMKTGCFSYELCKLIQEYTGGEVTIEELKTINKKKCPACGRLNAKT